MFDCPSQSAMTFGEAGKDGARVHNLSDVEAIVDGFVAHGHKEVQNALFYRHSNIHLILRSIPLVFIAVVPARSSWVKLIGKIRGF